MLAWWVEKIDTNLIFSWKTKTHISASVRYEVKHAHRSTDCTRSHQVSWSDVAAVDCVMGELLLHGPVHVLVMKRDIVTGHHQHDSRVRSRNQHATRFLWQHFFLFRSTTFWISTMFNSLFCFREIHCIRLYLKVWLADGRCLCHVLTLKRHKPIRP